MKITRLRLAFIAFMTVSALNISSCGPLCDDTVKSTTIAPDHSTTAVISERDCGATTDFVQFVTLKRNYLLWHEKENVFIVSGQPKIQIQWLTAAKLLVSCEACRSSTPPHTINHWKNIEIQFSIDN